MTGTTTHKAPLAGPLHAIILAFPVALYPATLVADIAYLKTAVVQWTNFAQWLNASADLFAGLLLAWALISAIVGRRRPDVVYLLVVAAMLVLGIVNAFQHARDAWASVGTLGVTLSALCTILAFAAAWLAHSPSPAREARV